MNDFVREFFEDQPELLRRYERNEARYILQLPKNYDTIRATPHKCRNPHYTTGSE